MPQTLARLQVGTGFPKGVPSGCRRGRGDGTRQPKRPLHSAKDCVRNPHDERVLANGLVGMAICAINESVFENRVPVFRTRLKEEVCSHTILVRSFPLVK